MPKHGHKRGWRRYKRRAKAERLRILGVMAKVLWNRIEVRSDRNFFKERQYA